MASARFIAISTAVFLLCTLIALACAGSGVDKWHNPGHQSESKRLMQAAAAFNFFACVIGIFAYWVLKRSDKYGNAELTSNNTVFLWTVGFCALAEFFAFCASAASVNHTGGDISDRSLGLDLGRVSVACTFFPFLFSGAYLAYSCLCGQAYRDVLSGN